MALANFSPTVLLVDESGSDCYQMKSWFETNGYNVRETNNVYDALEEMTDITLELRPSMILLNSYSSPRECSWLIDSLQECAAERDVPIVSLRVNDSEQENPEQNENFVYLSGFESLKPLMQTLLPIYLRNSAAA